MKRCVPRKDVGAARAPASTESAALPIIIREPMHPSKRSPPRRKRLVLAALSILMNLVVAEVACRLIGDPRSPHEPVYAVDEEVGFRPSPGFDDGVVRITANGFRDDEPVPSAKPPGEIRVLFLGDSFVYAAHVAFADVVTERLEQAMAPAGRVRVINAGCPAWSTVHERFLLERHGIALAPDVVVVGLFVGNDVMESASGDRWHVNEDHSLGVHVHVSSLRKRVLRSSALYRRIEWMRRSLRDSDEAILRDALDFEVEQLRLEQWRRGAAEEPPLSEGWRLVEESLAAMRDLVRGRGAELLVAVFPDEAQVDERIRAETVRRSSPPIDFADYELDQPQRLVGRICVRLGIDGVDLLPAMRARGARGGLFRELDTHWNEAVMRSRRRRSPRRWRPWSSDRAGSEAGAAAGPRDARHEPDAAGAGVTTTRDSG
jgi:hypothetical protein